jgi:hypothetical protein
MAAKGSKHRKEVGRETLSTLFIIRYYLEIEKEEEKRIRE